MTLLPTRVQVMLARTCRDLHRVRPVGPMTHSSRWPFYDGSSRKSREIEEAMKRGAAWLCLDSQISWQSHLGKAGTY